MSNISTWQHTHMSLGHWFLQWMVFYVLVAAAKVASKHIVINWGDSLLMTNQKWTCAITIRTVAVWLLTSLTWALFWETVLFLCLFVFCALMCLKRVWVFWETFSRLFFICTAVTLEKHIQILFLSQITLHLDLACFVANFPNVVIGWWKSNWVMQDWGAWIRVGFQGRPEIKDPLY